MNRLKSYPPRHDQNQLFSVHRFNAYNKHAGLSVRLLLHVEYGSTVWLVHRYGKVNEYNEFLIHYNGHVMKTCP